ncbi:MAG: hypothetical protein FWD47_08395 [Treponema sp.]|nr:hypothetical protein [Treponema sp.]
MNKTDYIKQLKGLIKKYHPDLHNDSYCESVYNEITKKLVNKLNELKTKENIHANTKEQDYTYYKEGIKYYKNIHPNSFYKRNHDTTFETKPYDELVSVLNNIYLSFNLSEHYFNLVVSEYPKSSYAEDSKEKIKLLKKLHKSYESIKIEENKIVDSTGFMNQMELKMM